MDGFDLPGDLIVGDRALERALRAAAEVSTAAISESDRHRVYFETAVAAQRGELVSSSAGGEQAKFLACVRRNGGANVSVLVKFSAAEPSPVSERWADLLCCEHLAAETLRAHGFACAATQILDAGGRRFLEVERFDRVAAAGRRGLITLGTVEDALAEGHFSDWVAAAVLLEQQQWMTSEDSRALRALHCFGDLIANSDMHRANASFWFGDELPFRLAPCYDMLPMAYAPGAQGDMSERAFVPRPPLDAVTEVWGEAARIAGEFWERITGESRVSDAFRRIAEDNRAIVLGLVRRFG
ncbi:MAG: HipA domain-containing protein [Pirellulales bacterium]|nr:HipA domain-containing protein [Pirellulales bacterium]